MELVYRHWAGIERAFALDFGLACDIETACGDVGIGAVYLHLASHQYHAREPYHVIRLALIGGGMDRREADRLVKQRFSEVPLADSVAVAIDVLAAMNEGVKVSAAAKSGDAAEPIDLGKVLANFAKAGIGPDVVRAMRYADFVNLVRSLGGDTVQPPSEEEFADMLRRYEARYPDG